MGRLTRMREDVSRNILHPGIWNFYADALLNTNLGSEEDYSFVESNLRPALDVLAENPRLSNLGDLVTKSHGLVPEVSPEHKSYDSVGLPYFARDEEGVFFTLLHGEASGEVYRAMNLEKFAPEHPRVWLASSKDLTMKVQYSLTVNRDIPSEEVRNGLGKLWVHGGLVFAGNPVPLEYSRRAKLLARNLS